MKTIILAITGSIAASKGIKLYDDLQKKYHVRLVITESGLKFLHQVPKEALTKIFSQNFYDKTDEVDHIEICNNADLFVSYPASINFMSSCAYGLTTEIASLVYLACASPKIHFPSMNTNMYNSKPHQNAISLLKNYGDIVIEANEGLLACGTTGIGRAKEVNEVIDIIDDYFKRYDFTNLNNLPLKNKKVLINFGRTRAYIDEVRYITNNSSGKMGVALYHALKEAGANVIAVAGDTDGDVDASFAEYAIDNETMLAKVQNHIDNVDIFISCGALNDFKIKEAIKGKVDKKATGGKLNLELTTAVDVLETLGKNKKANQLFIGFSVQSDFNDDYAMEKLMRKNLDAIIMNKLDVMGKNESELKFLTKTSKQEFAGSKKDVASFIVEQISKKTI